MGGVRSTVRKNADHDVEHDLAQHPQPDDEGRVQIDEGDGDGGGHDDGRQRHPPTPGILAEPGAPGVRMLFRHAGSITALRTSET